MSQRAQQGRIEEEDDTDDSDLISVRALSLARYKRNHEFMNEIFIHAALGTEFMLGMTETQTVYRGKTQSRVSIFVI